MGESLLRVRDNQDGAVRNVLSSVVNGVLWSLNFYKGNENLISFLMFIIHKYFIIL